jgi:competence protein ComGC
MKALKTKAPAFTLIEMVIVIAIIAMLVLLISPNLLKQKDRAEKTSDQAFKTTLQTQIDLSDKKINSWEQARSEKLLSDQQIKKAEAHYAISNGKVTEK